MRAVVGGSMECRGQQPDGVPAAEPLRARGGDLDVRGCAGNQVSQRPPVRGPGAGRMAATEVVGLRLPHVSEWLDHGFTGVVGEAQGGLGGAGTPRPGTRPGSRLGR
jgi:hypothetical protein